MIRDGGLRPYSYIMIEHVRGLRPHSYIMIRAWWPEALLIHNDRAWWPEAPLIHDDIRWWPEANSYIMIEHGGLRPHSYIIMGRWAYVGGFIMGSQWPTRESAQSHHLNSNFLLLRRVDGSKQIRKLSLLLSCLFV